MYADLHIQFIYNLEQENIKIRIPSSNSKIPEQHQDCYQLFRGLSAGRSFTWRRLAEDLETARRKRVLPIRDHIFMFDIMLVLF